MPHLDINGFYRYAGQQKAWSQARFAPIEDANWQWTERKGAVAFWPIGGQEIEPIVNFKFTETPPAEGTKSLDNPSTINGVSSVRSIMCGKNLCPIENYHIDFGQNLTVSMDPLCGKISISGSTNIENNANLYLHTKPNNHDILHTAIQDGETYTFSFLGNAPETVKLNLFTKQNPSLAWIKRLSILSGQSATYTIPAGIFSALLRIDIESNTNVDCECYVQVEQGSYTTAYEIHEHHDSIFSLNDTYYGGSLNLRTGELTVTHFGAVLTGIDAADAYIEGNTTINVRKWPNYINSNITSTYGVPRPKSTSTLICDNFITASTPNDSERISVGSYNVNNRTSPIGFRINKTRLDFSNAVNPSLPTAAEVRVAANAYFAQHPYQIAYELYTPYTIQLNSTQILSLLQKDKYTPRLNTFYSDQESVQVGYRKSPIRNELEQVQSILDLGGV